MTTAKRRITVDELNEVYYYINKEYRINGYPIKDSIELTVERTKELTGEIEELTFKFKQENIGMKGSYVFTSTDLYVDGIESPYY